MNRELIFKKTEQIRVLLRELQQLLNLSYSDFQKDFIIVRASERSFQLIVDLAVDINTQLLVEQTGKTPDTYRQSFSELERAGIMAGEFIKTLAESAKLRNVIVHEYDIEEDIKKFYDSAKKMIPAYQDYIQAILLYCKRDTGVPS